MSTPSSKVFTTDYTSKSEVIALAKDLASNCIVIKHAGRPSYNITHYERRDRWDIPGVTVVWWHERYGPLPTTPAKRTKS